MEHCHACNAPYTSFELTCEYCGAIAPQAVREQREAAARKAAEQEAEAKRAAEREAARQRAQREEEARERRARAQADVDRYATRSLLGALLGPIVGVLLPVGPLLALFWARKSRRLAGEVGLAVPPRVQVATWVARAGLVVGVFFWGVILWSQVKKDARQEELRAWLGSKPAEASLSRETACALLELHLLDNYDSELGYTIVNTLRCEGPVEQRGVEAVLNGAQMQQANEPWRPLYACFTYKGAWSVRQVRGDAPCTLPPLSAEPTP